MTTILVADDVDENRYMLTSLLKGNGYDVIVAVDGAEALRLAQSAPPDLIVTDIMMPEMDGFELCRRWKQDDRLRRIPFVIYTATYTDPKDERLALSLGADRFLVKPQRPEAILRVVHKILEVAGRDPDAVRVGAGDDEVALLHQHREALMRKVEKKVLDLESEVDRRKAVEAELREKERKYRLLAENSLDVVWSMDLDGRLTYVSPSIQKLQEFTPEKIMELPLREYLGPAVPKMCDEEVLQSAADSAAGRPQVRSGIFELEQPRKDGSTVWVETSVNVMRDEKGNSIGVQGVSRDVSKRRQAEQDAQRALKNLERRTRELAGLLDGAQAILAGGDFDTTVRYIFDRARELTGARAGYVALLSKSGEENELVFLESGGPPCSVDPSLPMPIRGLRAEVYRSGEAACDNDFMNGHWASLMPHGHVELRNVLFAPLNIHGETVGIMGLANKPGDFDDGDKRVATALAQLAALGLQRWRAEQKLEESTDLLRIAGRMARIGGWSVDLNEKRVRWSDEVAAIHGMPAGYSPTVDEGIGFYAPEWRARITEVFDACARDGAPYDEEMEVIAASGKRVWVRTIGEAVRDGAGNITRVHGAFQDIIDRKQAEAERQNLHSQLLQAQKIESIGRLAGGVAHDFNNCLNVVQGFTQICLAQLREGDPLIDDLEQVMKASERAAGITKQLLAFSRSQIVEPRVLDLNFIIDDTSKMLQRLLGEDIAIEKRLQMDIGHIYTDQGQMVQVLMNLAVNARDAMPSGGTLRIATESCDVDEGSVGFHPKAKPGRYVKLTVSDTGCGMDSETQRRIFEPFFTTKGPSKGTGLGLATVYGIVQQNSGFIEFHSETGAGTSFTIYLPRTDERPDCRPRQIGQAIQGGHETILVVEDEEPLRNLMRRILEESGYKVFCAANGGEALLACERGSACIDLMITDVVMPGMSGVELAKRVAAECPEMKVLYTSGYTDDAVLQHGIIDPERNLIRKPYTISELRHKVRSMLHGIAYVRR